MKRLLLVLCTVALLTAPALAGTSEAPSGDIGAIESTYRSLGDISSTFVQTTDIALVGKTVTKRGTFQFKKGGKIRIEYEGKDGKHYVCDGTTLWTFVPGDEASLQTFTVNDRTMPKEALSFMSGFGKLTREFAVTPSSAFAEAPAGTTALHLLSLIHI